MTEITCGHPGENLSQPRLLIGREAEFALLANAVRTVSVGTPWTVVLDGDPGVGKSVLLRSFVGSLPSSVLVIRASGEESEQRLDFGLVEQLYADFASVGLRVPPAPLGREARRPDPIVVGAALLEAITEVAADRPLVLVLDDAQWADAASIDAVGYALRRLRKQPILTVIARRETSAALTPFDRMCQDERGEQIHLTGFSPEHVRQLVKVRRGVVLGERAVTRLHGPSGGNPLAITSLIDELTDTDLTASFGQLPAPRSYATLVLNRVSGCGPEAERLVSAVAVLGRPTDLGSLASLLELDQVAGDILDDVIRRKLLVADTRGGRPVIDVAHPLVRNAILADLSPGARCELHRRAAAITADPPQAMLHRLRSTLGNEPTLAGEAIALARRLLDTGWNLIAIEVLIEATEHLDDCVERDEALLWAAHRLLRTGDQAAARELMGRVHPEAGGPLGQLVRGQDFMVAGDVANAVQCLRAAWDLKPDPEVGALVAGLSATLAANEGRPQASFTWSRRALSQAGAHGHLRSGLAEVDDWISGMGSHLCDDTSPLTRGMVLLWDGRLAEAETAFDLARTAVGSTGPLLARATAAYSLADTLYRRGNWDRALEVIDELAHHVDSAGHQLAQPMTHGIAAFVHAARGNEAEAEARLASGHAAQTRSGNVSGLLWLAVADARVGVALGDSQRVAEKLLPLTELLRSGALPEGVQPWRADLVEALISLDRLDEATVAMAELDERLDGGGPHVTCGAERARAALLAALGCFDEAATTLKMALHSNSSVQEHRGEKSPEAGIFTVARLEMAAGSFERRRGQRRVAAELLARAADGFAGLGARPFEGRARQELASCGLTPRRREDGATAKLTPAERAVVALVADGLTNREVAARLFISVKTVETHLGRSFTKLEVRTRTALAVRVRDLAGEKDTADAPC